MTATDLAIKQIETTNADFGRVIAAIRAQLSPSGNVVSEAGRALTQKVFGQPLSPQESVQRICDEIRTDGLCKVLEYTNKLDSDEVNASNLRVSQAAIQAAHAAASDDFLQMIRAIRDNIESFQQQIKHETKTITRQSIRFRHVYTPLRRIGICVPGGAAAYPSTVLMTAVPATVAGVSEIVVVAPPTRFGANNPDVLATCHELGIKEVYRVGGAQAVAAMAYGVEGLPAVDKIVGPGNLFVALAKKYVYGQVDIDSIAGPSEVLVIADRSANPAFVAADLLAQAEHSPGASILVSWDAQLIENVRIELAKQLSQLSRSDLTRRSLEEYACLIRCRDLEESIEIANLLAPEHLHVESDQAELITPKLRNAGAVFVGHYNSVALGDYVAGPSHVLPTGGTATWASGLTVNDFLRSYTEIHYDQAGLELDGANACMLATREELTAHRKSIEMRMSKGK
jgi:histidinol dehydrogenase